MGDPYCRDCQASTAGSCPVHPMVLGRLTTKCIDPMAAEADLRSRLAAAEEALAAERAAREAAERERDRWKEDSDSAREMQRFIETDRNRAINQECAARGDAERRVRELQQCLADIGEEVGVGRRTSDEAVCLAVRALKVDLAAAERAQGEAVRCARDAFDNPAEYTAQSAAAMVLRLLAAPVPETAPQPEPIALPTRGQGER